MSEYTHAGRLRDGEVIPDYGNFTIITNGVPRDVIDDWDQQGEQNDSFITYKGEKYDLGDFQSVSGILDPEHPFRKQKWDGWIAEGFFMGILLKWVPGTDFEQVIMGRYYT